MRQTLLLIPHDWIAYYALPLWCVVVLVGLIIQVKRFGWGKESLGMLWVLLIGGGVIWFVLPRIEIAVPDPANPELTIQGLPIRGFGLMFLGATVSGVWLAMRRAKQMGVDPEHILALAFGMFVSGIIGARVYYVIQYWDQFQSDSAAGTLSRVINTTQGGIVVYGALIGSLLAAIIICWRRKLPLLAVADLIAPGMAIGLAIGRIGCFMNGCCYGGPCDWPIAVQFPDRPAYSDVGQLSPPYDKQLTNGRLIGLTTRSNGEGTGDDWRTVVEVEAGSAADEAGIGAGSKVRRTTGSSADAYRLEIMAEGSQKVTDTLEIPLMQLPRRAAPVHPTQLYSSINALILCLFLWFYYPFRYGDGEVIGVGLVLYAISRFLLEMIRDDEPGQFNTELTTAQWTSLIMLLLGIGLIAWCRWRRTASRLPMKAPGESLKAPAMGSN